MHMVVVGANLQKLDLVAFLDLQADFFEHGINFRVEDHGIGIPAKELATLGTRFFRASNAVQAEITGTGLGLRIVQTIADNHGGRLELESTEGEGTTARLVIPLAHDAQSGNIPQLEEITEG